MPDEPILPGASLQRLDFTVSPGESGQRLDRFLSSQLPQLSRTSVQSLMDEGRVRVEGVARKPSYRVAPGELVRIEIPPRAPAQVVSEPIPLEILYEDEDIVVVNKPAGMTVHPGAGVEAGTLVAALLHRFGGLDQLSDLGGPLRPGIVHRLDRGTSGVLIIARNNRAHRSLTEQFRKRQIDKNYLVLVHGRMKEDSGRIELPVARDLRRRSRMTARRRIGRPARTDWRVLLRLPAFTLVSADLHTGRTHQLRVHFSALGHPVVGDTVYGAPRQPRVAGRAVAPLGRNFLHAFRIRFEHPRRGVPIEVRAPLPAELVDYLHQVGGTSDMAPGLIDASLREYL